MQLMCEQAKQENSKETISAICCINHGITKVTTVFLWEYLQGQQTTTAQRIWYVKALLTAACSLVKIKLVSRLGWLDVLMRVCSAHVKKSRLCKNWEEITAFLLIYFWNISLNRVQCLETLSIWADDNIGPYGYLLGNGNFFGREIRKFGFH